MNEGAIETLLINADLLKLRIKLEKYVYRLGKKLDDVGDLVQCSSEHDDGKQLLGMGGVIALHDTR